MTEIAPPYAATFRPAFPLEGRLQVVRRCASCNNLFLHSAKPHCDLDAGRVIETDIYATIPDWCRQPKITLDGSAKP